jgi:glycosyltransferase involved in cell wall biosynthesis
MLSVVLATHNEEENLDKALSSVKDLADEIIIVDGESTDRTLEIAHKYRARVIKTTNKTNFHINKQMAMSAAKFPLVLQLDADEVVDTTLKKFIRSLLGQLKNHQKLPAAAWWIKRKNFFCGRFFRKGGQYPDPVIRLYQRGRAYLPAADVHEQMQVDGETATAEGHLLHYSNPTFSDYWRKFNTYTSFKAKQHAEAKLSVNPFTGLSYLLFKPSKTFLLIYFRHKGFMDGWQGLVFALFSGLHHSVAYLKYLKIKYAN